MCFLNETHSRDHFKNDHIRSTAEMEAKLSIVQRWFGHVQCVGTIDALFSSDI